jgi:hypothetical protein
MITGGPPMPRHAIFVNHTRNNLTVKFYGPSNDRSLITDWGAHETCRLHPPPVKVEDVSVRIVNEPQIRGDKMKHASPRITIFLKNLPNTS